MTLSFFIPGDPIAKGRPRFGCGRTYTPTETRNWEAYVKLAAAEHAPGELMDGALLARFAFVLQRPKGVPKKRSLSRTKPDLDNCIKAITDSCEGVIFTNDSRIAKLVAVKRYCLPDEAPGVHVAFETLEE